MPLGVEHECCQQDDLLAFLGESTFDAVRR